MEFFSEMNNKQQAEHQADVISSNLLPTLTFSAIHLIEK
jgi:hypothetical protein